MNRRTQSRRRRNQHAHARERRRRGWDQTLPRWNKGVFRGCAEALAAWQPDPEERAARAARERWARREAHRLARRLETAVRRLSEKEAATAWRVAAWLRRCPSRELVALFYDALDWEGGGGPGEAEALLDRRRECRATAASRGAGPQVQGPLSPRRLVFLNHWA